MQDTDPIPPRRSFRVGSFTLLLLILFFPYLLTRKMQQWSGVPYAESGSQPGGEITGLVTDGEGRPLAGQEIVLHLSNTAGVRDAEATVETDADGSFLIVAPPHEGYYLLNLGGGDWRRVVNPVSLLDLDVEADERLPALEFELDPGSTLQVDFVQASGRAIRGGVLYLDGQIGASWPWSMFSPKVHLEQNFDGPQVIIDGLPALEGGIRIELDNGDSIEFEVELGAGEELEWSFDL